MRSPTVFLALGLASSAYAAAPTTTVPSVLVLDVKPVAVPPETAQIITGLVTDAVGHAKVRVVAAEDLRRMVELEAQKQAVGCDTTSCLGEIANAMGVDYVVFGDVGALGSAMVVTLRLFDAKKNETRQRESIQAQSVDEVRAQLAPTVHALMGSLAGDAPANTLLIGGGVVAGAGVVLAGITGGIALGMDNDLGNKAASPDARATALGVEPVLLVVAGVGVVATVAGAVVGAIALTGQP